MEELYKNVVDIVLRLHDDAHITLYGCNPTLVEILNLNLLKRPIM